MQGLADQRIVERRAREADERGLEGAPAAERSGEQLETARIAVATRAASASRRRTNPGVLALELLQSATRRRTRADRRRCQYGSSVPAPPSATR